MTIARNLPAALALSVVMLPQAVSAETIIANCTGMLDFDIYTIDTSQSSQEVENIGMAEVTVEEEAILLTGEFGEYRFDLEAGTLYHNGSDTGVYCTYSSEDK
ncbi:hypothetical protein [Sinisalibacter lacisalsi]|uniref:C-type lysozyme inhibitor domain-containing protein n=1 Tax=Sinisalibacter lacisalsi TaxID=1526570 RepID=A0ABQ1QTT4_9RHOB|nr:hypothetical protein [Sinisalibacter lacisalsi]GGD41906.1 hypothetical protein GCM10011358_27210 [Sinisalibacter lacisalsi]